MYYSYATGQTVITIKMMKRQKDVDEKAERNEDGKDKNMTVMIRKEEEMMKRKRS